MQGLQIGDDRVFFDALFLQVHHQVRLAAISLTNQSADDVQTLPIEPMYQLRSLPLGCPGAMDAGFEGKPALIEETYFDPSLKSPLFDPRPLFGKPTINLGLIAFLSDGFGL